MRGLTTLRSEVESCFHSIIKDPKRRKIPVSRRATGSASGLPFEPWARDILQDCGFSAFLQEEFIDTLVREMRKSGYNDNKISYIIKEETWWGMKDYMVSRKQLEAALKNTDIPTYQQSIADIVLFYGNDIVSDHNDIIIINVKSHDIDRESRDPNIISAKRVLEFFKDLSKKAVAYPDFIDKANLWFIGFYYKRYRNYSEIKEIYVKDLFKLDVTRIPVINFDAAIQIQWHVKNMIEKEDMDKLKFIESLAEEYLKRWQEFVQKRTQKLEETIHELKLLIKKVKAKEGFSNRG